MCAWGRGFLREKGKDQLNGINENQFPEREGEPGRRGKKNTAGSQDPIGVRGLVGISGCPG